MSFTVHLRDWQVILVVWLLGLFISISTDKSTGITGGLQGLLFSGFWSFLVMLGTLVYLVIK